MIVPLRHRLRTLGLAIAIVLVPACLAPPIVLPPPTGSLSALSATGTVTVTGQASPDAYVFVLDDLAIAGTGVIVQAHDAGDYSATLAAHDGDHIEVWQEIGTTRSQVLDLYVGTPTADH